MKEETRRRAEAYEQNKKLRALRMSRRELLEMESDRRVEKVSGQLAVSIIELANTCETFEMVKAIPKAITRALDCCDITENKKKFLQSLVLQLNYEVRKEKEKVKRNYE